MKKHFLLILISFIFLGACATEEEFDVDPDSEEMFDPSGNGAEGGLEEELSLSSTQVCWANLIRASWLCEKEGQSYSYIAKQDPGTFNDDGVTVRLCELEASDESLLPIYANSQKDHCVNRLNQEVEKKRNEGFNCRVTDEQTNGEPEGSCA